MTYPPKNSSKVRVAAAQFGAGQDVDQNLATCLKAIDQAAECQPDFLVLPEFSNHCSWYDNKEHCYKVSVPVGGPFLNTIAEKAKRILSFYLFILFFILFLVFCFISKKISYANINKQI